MAENKITLGQLVTVLTESGIDLNEIYLDENQINSMQTSLSEENQKKLVGFVSELMQSVPDEELSKLGGGKIEPGKLKELKDKAKEIAKVGGITVGTIVGAITAGGLLVEGLAAAGATWARNLNNATLGKINKKLNYNITEQEVQN